MVLHILRRASHGAGGAGPAGIVLAAWTLFAPCGLAGSSEPATSTRAGTGRTSSPTGQEPAERQAPEQPAGRRARAAAGDEFAAARVRLYQHRPAEEFYDLEADPYELHNLAEEAKYREQMDKMRAELLAWMLKQGDRGVATELEAPRHQGRAAADNQPANAEGRQRRAG